MPFKVPELTTTIDAFMNEVYRLLKGYTRWIPFSNRVLVPEVSEIVQQINTNTISIRQVIFRLEELVINQSPTETELLRQHTNSIKAGLSIYLTKVDEFQRNLLLRNLKRGDPYRWDNNYERGIYGIIDAMRCLPPEQLYTVFRQVDNHGEGFCSGTSGIDRFKQNKKTILPVMEIMTSDQLYIILSTRNERGITHIRVKIYGLKDNYSLKP